MRLLKSPIVTGFLFLISLAPAAEVKVETGKAVPSPDGKQVASVDRLASVVDGEPEAFSGRMVFRISDAKTKATLKQRYLEASQVRVIQPPVWLDASLCAFVYNVAKNAHGIVYLELDTGKALQVDFVATSRRMAASDKVEQELTSLDVTEHSAAVTRIHNITYRGGSAFPLRLAPLPLSQPMPFPKSFMTEVSQQLAEYRALCEAHGVSNILSEQATESISPDGSRLAVLACADRKSVICLTSLQQDAATSPTLSVLPDIRLPCTSGIGAQTEIETAQESPPQDFRYLTSWKDDATAAVEREVFDDTGENSKMETTYLVSVSGELKKAAPSPKTAERKPAPPSGESKQ